VSLVSEMPMLFTPVQAARVLGVSRSQVYVLMKGGQLGSVHIGRSRRIAKEHVVQFIDRLMEA
jgi:excisionase family DNA binding protein